MIVFPNAKINLGLNVISRRTDGYHEIETVFYPIQWTDVLEIKATETLDYSSSGIDVPGTAVSNLCVKAFKLISSVFNIDAVNIHLLKNIPIGAGLGGGSSDGAFMMKLLNEYFHLDMSNEQLKLMAKELGADCPFFIENKPLFAAGIGDEFEDITIDLKGYKIVIIYPSIAVNTSWAYNLIKPSRATNNVKDIVLNYPITSWKQNLVNDFEKVVFEAHPLIGDIKEKLYEANAIYASMSGSGSTVFGIFENHTSINNIEQYAINESFTYRILNL